MSRGFDDRRGFFNDAVPALPGVWNSWAGFDAESVFTQYPAVGRLSAAGSDSGPACPAKESQRRTAAMKGGSRQYLVRYCRAVGNSLPGAAPYFFTAESRRGKTLSAAPAQGRRGRQETRHCAAELFCCAALHGNGRAEQKS
ncbi:hypothetical protein CNY67_00885 [Desulfovibrio sp. G11]|nr:hypothetical protein CNY67_00885 [Desulfovibrio sp. G11]